jgi:DNA-binding transcriptional regulator PaaX
VSFHVLNAVWKLPLELPLGPTDKLVLVKLADYARDDGGNVYPSVATVARECWLSERSVRYALGRLLKAGHIRKEVPAGRYRPATYRVMVARC